MVQEKAYKVGRALFIAPLVIPLFVSGLALMFGDRFDDFAFMIILVITSVGYLATLLIGLPSFYLLRHFGCLNLVTLSVSGFFLGSIIALVLGLNGKASFDFLLGSVLGFLTALFFGLMAGVKVFNNGVDPDRKY